MANDWWSKKIGTGGSSTSSTPPTTPYPGTVYRHPSGPVNPRVEYNPENDQLMTKAMSAKSNDRCPSCNSGNYAAPLGTSRFRCYDCGYPIVQAGSGIVTSSGNGGAAIPAKQAGQGGGFNPNIIVDRIG